MQANAALYLPVEEVDLSEVFPGARPAGGIFRRKSAFSVPFKDTYVRFNIMPSADVPGHLEQFAAYVESLGDSPSDKEAAKVAIARSAVARGTALALGVMNRDAPLPEIYCDINARMTDNGYSLERQGSIEDLARLGLTLDMAVGEEFLFSGGADEDDNGQPADIVFRGMVVKHPAWGYLAQADAAGIFWRARR